MKMKSIIQFLIGVSFVAISACGGSGGGSGGGGGGDDVEFPTPTLPAGARTIDALNAEETADEAVEFIGIFASFVEFKTEAPPSIPQAIKLVIDQVARKNRKSGSVAAAKTEDVSADFGCLTGTATLDFEESANSASGKLTISDCDIEGSGIFVNGTVPFEASWNNNTLDFRNQLGGTLTFDDTVDLVTIVLNLIETGNDGTLAFALTPDFSLEGIPGGGFLVTTAQPFMGDIFVGVTSGESIVEGADNTRLCMLVTDPDELTVDLDDGLGDGCMPLVPPLIIDLS
jgi:hypothetical protein